MTNVITYGTFDTFHFGHVNLLLKAASLGSKLYVGLSDDGFNKLKGKEAHFDYQTREKHLKSLRCVHEVFPEKNWEQKSDDIEKYGIDLFVMGSDWAGHFNHLEKFCKVVYLPRTPSISSTAMRSQINLVKAYK